MTLVVFLAVFTPFWYDASAQTPIPDSALESAIRDELGKPTGNLTSSDMATLTSLTATSLNIADLTGLEAAVNLTFLDLGFNQISNLSPLSGLTQLGQLWLENNLITDIGVLAVLVNLRDDSGRFGVGLRLQDNFIDVRPGSSQRQIIDALNSINGLTVEFEPQNKDIFHGQPIDGFPGWRASQWYLNYNVDFWPWIYHDEHGWQFVFEDTQDEVIFLWDWGFQEWLFLNENTYRWMFLFGDSPEWIWTFEDNTPDRRFFQRFDDGSIFSTSAGFEPISAGFALIPAGTFTMGSPSNEPGRRNDEVQHSVTISESFYMGTTEVTNEQMRVVMQWAYDHVKISAFPSTVRNLEGIGQNLLDLGDPDIQISFAEDVFVVDAGKENYPVMEVTWYGAMAYANYLSDMEGRERAVDFTDWTIDWTSTGYRLPTEAEWEYATRAGTTTAFYTGPITYILSRRVDPNLDRAGWFVGNSTNTDNPMSSEKGTHPVGRKVPNAWGLYDTHGNVWEWCWDWRGSYDSDAQTDPRGPTSGFSGRVNRGGSWSSDTIRCRSAWRDGGPPSGAIDSLGFRLAHRVGP